MKYIDIPSISALHEFFRCEKPVHPLISIVDLAKIDRSHRQPGDVYRLNLYAASCKIIKGNFGYGRTNYDFAEGSLMFTAPHQALSPDPDIKVMEGWGLYIHPDFLNADPRGRKLTELSFFGYDANEALHISDSEKVILEGCIRNIQREIALNLDKHSYHLIISNLELFFAYCTRFYDRQFLTRTKPGNDIVQKFDRLLSDYFNQESLIENGLPDVKYFASQLHLSPNYLSDLLNKYTGNTTQEHIYFKLIDKAKTLLWSTEKPISEIAYDLGFAHPSHFTKLFKNKTGLSPSHFRNQN
ncbi:AraC family transcriptional regulator [Chitinophaga sp. OAE865]|uniref:helix-turn-helix domain-containing protein n=1 Tax=Chitinophaga sp. OAE865 TaxID=2817898 RepID=UPI001AEB35F5